MAKTKPLVSLVSVEISGHDVPVLVIQTVERSIVSVPSQIGCAARCSFCVSSTKKPVRSLAGSEIWQAAGDAADELLSGKSFELAVTGEGESTLNPVGVANAFKLAAASGRVKSARVATMGAKVRNIALLSVPGIPVELQLSVHATNDIQRKKLMPASPAWADLELSAKQSSSLFTGIRMNYVLIDGFNDSEEDALKLSRMGSNWRITLSPPLGEVKDSRRVDQFAELLRNAGRTVTVFNKVGLAINDGLYKRLTYQPSESIIRAASVGRMRA